MVLKVKGKSSWAAQRRYQEEVKSDESAPKKKGRRRRARAKVAYLAKKKGKQRRLNQKVNYHDYINSAAWKKKRQLALKIHGDKCKICGTGRRLQVHHKTYKRLGRERISDLQILCFDCHAMEHDNKVATDSLTQEYQMILG